MNHQELFDEMTTTIMRSRNNSVDAGVNTTTTTTTSPKRRQEEMMTMTGEADHASLCSESSEEGSSSTSSSSSSSSCKHRKRFDTSSSSNWTSTTLPQEPFAQQQQQQQQPTLFYHKEDGVRKFKTNVNLNSRRKLFPSSSSVFYQQQQQQQQAQHHHRRVQQHPHPQQQPQPQQHSRRLASSYPSYHSKDSSASSSSSLPPLPLPLPVLPSPQSSSSSCCSSTQYRYYQHRHKNNIVSVNNSSNNNNNFAVPFNIPESLFTQQDIQFQPTTMQHPYHHHHHQHQQGRSFPSRCLFNSSTTTPTTFGTRTGSSTSAPSSLCSTPSTSTSDINSSSTSGAIWTPPSSSFLSVTGAATAATTATATVRQQQQQQQQLHHQQQQQQQQQQHQSRYQHHFYNHQQASSPTSNSNNNGNSNYNMKQVLVDTIREKFLPLLEGTRLTPKMEGIQLLHPEDVWQVSPPASSSSTASSSSGAVVPASIPHLLGTGAFSQVTRVVLATEDDHVTKAVVGVENDNDKKEEEEDSNKKLKQRKQYACKQLKKELLTDPRCFFKAATELAYEAHVLSSLDHPNIIQLRGWAAEGIDSFANACDGSEDKDDDEGHTGARTGVATTCTRTTSTIPSSFFLIMNVLWETLDQRIERWNTNMDDPNQPQSQSLVQFHQRNLEKLSYCKQLAAALDYIHSQGVVFRDLKPQNVGFCSDEEEGHQGGGNGTLKLFDFGLCQELPFSKSSSSFGGGDDRNERFELSGMVGTMRYMAPEVCLCQPYNRDCDIYSWSIVAWEILSQSKPYETLTPDLYATLVCRQGVRPTDLPMTVTTTPSSTATSSPSPSPSCRNSNNTHTSNHNIDTVATATATAVPEELKSLLKQAWRGEPHQRIRLLQIQSQLALFQQLEELRLEEQELEDSLSSSSSFVGNTYSYCEGGDVDVDVDVDGRGREGGGGDDYVFNTNNSSTRMGMMKMPVMANSTSYPTTTASTFMNRPIFGDVGLNYFGTATTSMTRTAAEAAQQRQIPTNH